MKVVIPGGEVFDLGATETTPTVGITDYSRRVTDDYGVTTVVARGFARRMSVRLGVPTELADAVLRKLAALRASTAQWVANDAYACLAINGFLKDFDFDFSAPPLSYCTLTVEGLTETEPFVDAGGDPAPFGQTSTLRLLQPATITDATLVSSNVAETDYPAWVSGTTYALGARVIKMATHRIYESAIAGNVGSDPVAADGKWLDIGPTNRWALFDQALGSTTTASSPIVITVTASLINAVALLDVVGTSVRVEATGYGKSQAVGAGAMTFLDLPAGTTRVTVTLTGSGSVSVGTLLVGKLVGLGVTEAAPTAGITDYSRKDVDDFGAVTIVERAWAKRMTAKGLISTAAIDSVFSRIAAVRATPSLWIGQDGYDSLTIYGFFKTFEIEAGDTVSKLSLSIEGLSTAGKIEPFAPGGGGSVDWPNVGDPDGTKPANNATNGRDPNSPLGSTTVGDFESQLAAARAQLAYINGTTIPTINTAVAGANTKIETARQAASDALAQAVALLDDKDAFLNRRIDSVSASGGYDDTNVYAEVRRVDQTAISRDGTIGQRIDSVITNYQTADTNTNARVDQVATSASNATTAVADLTTSVNARFTGVNSTLSTYDQRITTLSTNVTGYAGRTTKLEAAATSNGTYLNANASFAIWPDGQRLPSGWIDWNDPANMSVSRGANTDRLDSPYYLSANQTGPTTGVGFYQSLASLTAAGWYVIDAEAELVAGPWSGAGVTIGGAINLNFSTVADTAGLISATSLGLRRWSILVQKAAGGSPLFHAMQSWNGFDSAMPQKVISWRRVAVRAANDAEIKAGRANADLTSVTARVKTTEDTLADLPNRYAAASRTATLEAQVNGTAGSNLLARANDQATVIADAKVGVVTQSITTLSSRATTALANRGASFSEWPQGQAIPSRWNPWPDANISTTRITGVIGTYSVRQDAVNGAFCGFYTDKTVDPSLDGLGSGPYVLRADVTFIGGSLRGSGMLLRGYNASGGTVTEIPFSFLNFEASPGVSMGTGEPNKRYLFTKAVTLPAGVVSVGLFMMTGWSGFVGDTSLKALQWNECGLRPATNPEAKVEDVSATLTQQAGTLALVNGRTSVYWQVTGTTPDGSATVQLSKADGTPGLFYIGANLLVDGNAIFNGTVTIRALDRSTMTATSSGSVSGTYGGVGQAAFAYIPNLGADMAIKSGGSIYLTFTGNIAATTDSSGTIYASFEILNAADNGVLASVRLPTPGFGPGGRLDNFVIRILNVWGDVTIRWRVANRATGSTWSIVQNPQCSVYWTAL